MNIIILDSTSCLTTFEVFNHDFTAIDSDSLKMGITSGVHYALLVPSILFPVKPINHDNYWGGGVTQLVKC